MPRSGFDDDGRAAATSTTTRIVSLGRTGTSQRISSRPERARVEEELEGQRECVESARDEPAVGGPRRGFSVEVKGLRVVAAGELDDLGLGDREARRFEPAPDGEVLEVERAHARQYRIGAGRGQRATSAIAAT